MTPDEFDEELEASETNGESGEPGNKEMGFYTLFEKNPLSTIHTLIKSTATIQKTFSFKATK